MDYALLKRRMVQQQLIPRGIKDPRVIDALLKVERHKFIPEELRNSAYADYPVPIGEKQTISQPYIVALMTESLDLSCADRVLEIGTGSGYQTAILAELAQQVYSIERFPVLAKRAEALLKDLDYSNVKIKLADGTLGWVEEAPFSRIIVTAAAPKVPLPLIEQLTENGKMVLPLGEAFSQVLTVITKHEGQIKKEQICGCVFVPLIGEHAHKE
ncbi:protein-L-isoaspartate(D-aspartate) O-methyltransferase [Candidatus Omnitrophota bacterium]